VESKGDGRIFILNYPKITSFASATPAEYQLVKDFQRKPTMTLARCRRCGEKPRFLGTEILWDKHSDGRWHFWLWSHPAIYCPRCDNQECGCRLNDEWPEKNHYHFAAVRQVIGQRNQRNQ